MSVEQTAAMRNVTTALTEFEAQVDAVAGFDTRERLLYICRQDGILIISALPIVGGARPEMLPKALDRLHDLIDSGSTRWEEAVRICSTDRELVGLAMCYAETEVGESLPTRLVQAVDVNGHGYLLSRPARTRRLHTVSLPRGGSDAVPGSPRAYLHRFLELMKGPFALGPLPNPPGSPTKGWVTDGKTGRVHVAKIVRLGMLSWGVIVPASVSMITDAGVDSLPPGGEFTLCPQPHDPVPWPES